MHRYYIEQNFNPTYARLDSVEKLKQFMVRRCDMLQNKLNLPMRMFAGLDILEFGCAGGENALTAAMLGANVYLVEPVEAFHATIRDYFERYGQADRLELVSGSTLSDFISEKLFDMVLAEGFVYTTGPAVRWTGQLAGFCSDAGFVMMSICQTAGFLIEMLQSRVCRIAGATHNADKIDTAEVILGDKWRSIYHSRTFESWANDVLYNPYVDYASLNHSGDIVELMHRQGFDLYSAWPGLRRQFDVTWIKRLTSRDDRLCEHKLAAMQLLPSLIIGEPTAIRQPADSEMLEQLLVAIGAELQAMSDLDDQPGSEHLARLAENHQRCTAILAEVVADYEDTPLSHLMTEIADCLSSLGEPPAHLARLFKPDRLLGRAWGSPNQYLIFARASGL